MKVGFGTPVQFAGPRRQDWQSKVSDDLKAEYRQFQASQQDKPVRILVMLADQVFNRKSDIMARLAEAGLQQANEMKAIGVVSGELPLSKLPQVATLKEVDMVEKDREVSLPDPIMPFPHPWLPIQLPRDPNAPQ